MSAHVEPATVKHADELARNMRMADVLEVLAADGLGPLGALIHSMELSAYSFALYLGDELAAIWGVRTHPSGEPIACPWILTGSAVDRHPIAFWKWCKQTFPMICTDYVELFNFVDARHTQALRWAARLGFWIDAPRPYGKSQLPFHRIRLIPHTMRRAAHV